jgi:hypothetical protein
VANALDHKFIKRAGLRLNRGGAVASPQGPRPTLTFSQATGEVIVVPEPAAIAVAAVGLGTMGLALLRRRRA